MSGLEMKYFVLKPKGDNSYSEASRSAMKAYADSIKKENVQLCHDLHMWVIDEQGKVNEARLLTKLSSDDHPPPQ